MDLEGQTLEHKTKRQQKKRGFQGLFIHSFMIIHEILYIHFDIADWIIILTLSSALSPQMQYHEEEE